LFGAGVALFEVPILRIVTGSDDNKVYLFDKDINQDGGEGESGTPVPSLTTKLMAVMAR